MKWTYLSPYVDIPWTKRFVRHRPCGLREMLRQQKRKNRLKKCDNNFLKVENLKNARKPFCPHKPQRRNYNKFYRPMQIPA